MKVLHLIALLTLLEKQQCLKILGIFPPPANSHYTLASSLMRGLAEKGHDVTVISTVGEKTLPQNTTYRDIVVRGGSDADPKKINLFTLDEMNFVTFNLFMNFYGTKLTESVFEDAVVQKLIASKEKFDVVIVEHFVNDGVEALAHHFQAHLVLFVSFGSSSWLNSLVANPGPPSYIPEQNIPFDHRNFWDRVRNTVIYTFGQVFRHFVFFPQQNALIKKYLPGAPDIDSISKNVSLVLLNSHLSTNMAVPRVPCMVDIGGLHLKPTKKLPIELQQFLDGAKEGVVYFSMGSALQSVHLPPEKRQAFLNVFSKLKEKVLWKWEDDMLPGKPPNVEVRKWLPQNDILGHPNIKAFITHGGLLSLIESVHHGTPLLALPVFGDQIWNAASVTSNSLGRHILLSELDEKNFEEALRDVLTNPKYRENMKRRSKIMKDRRHSPIDEADYWIQYVVRHGGAPHLRVHGLDLEWYQYLLLDVVAFFSCVVALISFLVVLVLKMLRKKNKVKIN